MPGNRDRGAVVEVLVVAVVIRSGDKGILVLARVEGRLGVGKAGIGVVFASMCAKLALEAAGNGSGA